MLNYIIYFIVLIILVIIIVIAAKAITRGIKAKNNLPENIKDKKFKKIINNNLQIIFSFKKEFYDKN